MTIDILLFAAAREITGQSRIAVEVASGSRIRDVQRQLIAGHPQLEPLLKSAAWAMDCQYVGEDEALVEGAELGLILPVSGG